MEPGIGDWKSSTFPVRGSTRPTALLAYSANQIFPAPSMAKPYGPTLRWFLIPAGDWKTDHFWVSGSSSTMALAPPLATQTVPLGCWRMVLPFPLPFMSGGTAKERNFPVSVRYSSQRWLGPPSTVQMASSLPLMMAPRRTRGTHRRAGLSR